MILEFKNKDLYFIASALFSYAMYQFDRPVQSMRAAIDPAAPDNTMSAISITNTELQQVWEMVGSAAERYNSARAREIKGYLGPQLLHLAGSGDAEAIEFLTFVQQYDAANVAHNTAQENKGKGYLFPELQ